MIEVEQQRIVRVFPFQGTAYEASLAKLAIANYGFLLSGAGLPGVSKYTFGEFADQIERAYDMSNPQNAEVVNALRGLHLRNSQKQ